MKDNKTVNTLFLAFMIIFVFSLILGVFVFGSHLIDTGAFGTLSTTTSSTPLNAPSTITTILDILLGHTTNWTWEILITRGIIFIILFAFLSQLLESFTTYRKNTTTFIALISTTLLGLIGFIALIATWTRFGAILGGLGIAILLLSVIISGIIIHFGLGSTIRKLKSKQKMHKHKEKSEEKWKKRRETLEHLDEIDEETRLIREYGL